MVIPTWPRALSIAQIPPASVLIDRTTGREVTRLPPGRFPYNPWTRERFARFPLDRVSPLPVSDVPLARTAVDALFDRIVEAGARQFVAQCFEARGG